VAPTTLRPGETVTLHVDTGFAEADTYVVTLATTSGSTTQTAQLVLTLT
jgi:hypothetical protein